MQSTVKIVQFAFHALDTLGSHALYIQFKLKSK